MPIRDTERGGDRRNRFGAIARQDRELQAERLEPSHDRRRVRPQRLADGEHCMPVTMAERDQ